VGQAIGGSLPLAIGIALSPIPIIAVVWPGRLTPEASDPGKGQ
jgi:hypothetical protein